MFTRKINYIWLINLVLFAAVVFMGIEQAAKGAEISKYESNLEAVTLQKRDLSEQIFESGNTDKVADSALISGFVKPNDVVYINNIEVVASVR